VTPEERWIKIENAITENNRQIAENWRHIAENDRQLARMGERRETKAAEIDAQIEKNTFAIRDLTVVSRSVIESQKQLHTEIKADIERLIKAVEAFLKGFQKPNGHQ